MEFSHSHSQTHKTFPTQSGSAAFDWKLFAADLRKYVTCRLRGVDVSVVDDIVQEVAIVATSQTVDYSTVEEPLYWLKGVARNKINDYWRKQSKHPSSENYPDHLESMEPSPYEWVLQIETCQQVSDAFDKLPEEQKVLLEKKYLHGETCLSLSKSLGKSLKSIEYRLAKARQSLRDLLKINLQK